MADHPLFGWHFKICEPVFEAVHGDFELVEGVGVGDSDVAFAILCEGGAWDDGDSGFVE